MHKSLTSDSNVFFSFVYQLQTEWCIGDNENTEKGKEVSPPNIARFTIGRRIFPLSARRCGVSLEEFSVEKRGYAVQIWHNSHHVGELCRPMIHPFARILEWRQQ